MKRERFLIFMLALCLALALPACGSGGTAASGSDLPAVTVDPGPATGTDLTPAPTEAPEPTAEPAHTPDGALPVRVMVMNGPTGFGMAKLMHDAAEGEAAAPDSVNMEYEISVETDASNAAAALINGSVDIAVIPTNAAATVYNKTKGGVQAAALVVRGNLYLMQNTEKENITSIEDLRGRTVYAPAQNPTFILTRLCRQAGLEAGSDVMIDNGYAEPAALRDALAAGEVDLAVLPEPMVTIAMSKSEGLGVALDLDEVWKSTAEGGVVLGCVAVRTAFAAEHPMELNVFLNEYHDSVEYVTENPEASGLLIEETGIFAQAKVAEKAIPRCGLCFVTGGQMKDELSRYLEALFEVAPESVGGAAPGDDFYYGAG